MVKIEKNPGGTPIEVYDGLRKALAENRPQFFLDVASVRFTASIDPARRHRRESSRTGGVRG
jgi:hypothetical protein